MHGLDGQKIEERKDCISERREKRITIPPDSSTGEDSKYPRYFLQI